MDVDLGHGDAAKGYVVTGERLSVDSRIYSSADIRSLTGLQIEGGLIESGRLSLNEGGTTVIGCSTIRWQQRDPDARGDVDDLSTADLPIYINGERQALLATVNVALKAGLTRVKVIQRGCCLKTSM